MSPKSTEFLGKALRTLEMNSVHVLNWGSTRMAGFVYACKQSCDITIPFVDTLNAGGIRKDESAILLSPKGLYHLFADVRCTKS